MEGAETTIYEMGLGGRDAGLAHPTVTARAFSMSFDFGKVALKTYDPFTGREATSGGMGPAAGRADQRHAGGDCRGGRHGRPGGALFPGDRRGQRRFAGGRFRKRVERGQLLRSRCPPRQRAGLARRASGRSLILDAQRGMQSSVALTDLLANAFNGTSLAGATLRGINENNEIVYEIALQDALIKNVSDRQGSGLSFELDYRSIQVIIHRRRSGHGELGEPSKTVGTA